MSLGVALSLSLLLLVLNAFFVAAEFAVVAARRHRLEDRAAQGGRAARVAVRNARELSLMLAGAQLGITLCTLGLGALAKPAVADIFATLFGLAGLPDALAGAIGVAFGVAIVVFLHMVVGEMAPKSWAISDAERSAVWLGIPFRAFTTVVRPLLALLNWIANLLLRLVKVEPQDELANVHGPQELRMLLDSSRAGGLLPQTEHERLAGALALDDTPLYAATLPLVDAVTIADTARAGDVERVSLASGRSRLVVVDEAERPVGLVHVRDAITSVTVGRDDPVAVLRYPALVLDEHTPLLDAVSRMRAERAQLAFVGRQTEVVGIVALEDLLERVLGEFDDETDRN